MARPGRAWFPLSCDFTRDDKVLAAGWSAAELYLAALGYLYAHRSSNGRLSRQVAAKLGVNGWERRMDSLVKAGLVDEPDPDSFVIVAWDAWHEESDSARRTREWRDRQRNRDMSP